MRRSHRRGITLLEVIVAMSVMGAALGICTLVAGQATRVATDATARARRTRLVDARERLLRDLVERAIQGRDTLPVFEGVPLGTRFVTSCPSPRGWQERCTITLRIVPANRTGRLVVTLGAVRPFDVGIEGARRLLYLASAADGGAWLERWPESPRPPFAIGVEHVRSGRVDTTIARIGPRG
jgi:prepilin-type N-terminal cleavage/methylation domain-containing protein